VALRTLGGNLRRMEPQQRLDPLAVIPQPPHPPQQPAERIGFVVRGPLNWARDSGFPWATLLDVVLFTTLLGMGLAVLYWRKELGLDTFGGIFVNSAITPWVLATWSLLLGSSIFRRQNMVKAASAGICFSTGYLLLHYAGEVEEPWDFSSLLPLVGPALFEMGVVFFISKVFFMAEDAELQVERLEAELEAAKRSPGMGLAMSYFYNFLLPTAANWAGVGTKLELSKDTFVTVAEGPWLLVFVPRDLNEIDFKAQLRQMQTDKHVFLAKPVEAPGASHRPMFLYVLSKDDATKTAGFCFDVPTVISSCYDRAKKEAADAETEEGKREAFANVIREIVDFQNCLQELVKDNPITKERVQLVSIPPAPFEAQVFAHLARKLSPQ